MQLLKMRQESKECGENKLIFQPQEWHNSFLICVLSNTSISINNLIIYVILLYEFNIAINFLFESLARLQSHSL